MQELADILKQTNCSCAIRKEGTIHTFTKPGIADLHDIYKNNPAMLNEADVADKAVGKAAAAIMALGKIKRLFAGIISIPACDMLQNAGVEVECGKKVEFIMNRKKDGICPLEKLASNATTPEEVLHLINKFMETTCKA